MKFSNGFEAEFSIGPAGLSDLKCEWSPQMPSPQQLMEIEPEYRAHRDKFLAAEADKLGLEMVVMPWPGAIGFRRKAVLE